MKQEFWSEFVFKKERKYSNIWAIDTQNNSGCSRKAKKVLSTSVSYNFATIQVKASTGPTSLQSDSTKYNFMTRVYS